MSKKKNKQKDEVQAIKPIEIISAKIVDDFCEYSYEVKTGVGTGDTITVKNNKSKLINEDMRIAFFKLNVHLAVIDDVFAHSNKEFGNINKMHNDELSTLYIVNQFKVKGSEENKTVSLAGYKTLNIGNVMDLVSPKVDLSGMGGYAWYNELSESLNNVISEVEQYMNGKFTLLHIDEIDANQLTIQDEINSRELEDDLKKHD